MLISIPFAGVCAAGSTLVLVSKRISVPFITKEILASFPLNCNRLLQLEYFISLDPEAPTTGRPQGISLFSLYGNVTYIVGDDEIKIFRNEIKQKESGSYIKIYANNTDTFPHTVDSIVLIEAEFNEVK